MSPIDTRETLIARTIHVIAAEGMDKTTTKAITAGTGINEAYIYRCFSDKTDLLTKTFDALDEELVDACLHCVSQIARNDLSIKERCRFCYTPLWRFLLGNRDKCLAFIRYYYSPYFQKYSALAHKQRYAAMVERFALAFRKEANVWMILNHVLTTMLDFAVKVFNGTVPDDEDTEEHVFRVAYHSIEHYFKEN